MGDLTRNFSLYEFRQRSPLVLVPQALVPNVQRLANQLQMLRDVVGPIVITSSYRTEDHNRDVGGASDSQHLTAKAADFTVSGRPQSSVYCTILAGIASGAIEEGGLGWYGEGGHIHYDVRGSAARWNKSGGPVPVCPEIPTPTPTPEEEEDMAVMIQAHGEDAVYVTNFVVKAPVRNPAHRQYLIASGVKGPFPVDKAYVDAIQDADAVRGTIS